MPTIMIAAQECRKMGRVEIATESDVKELLLEAAAGKLEGLWFLEVEFGEAKRIDKKWESFLIEALAHPDPVNPLTYRKSCLEALLIMKSEWGGIWAALAGLLSRSYDYSTLQLIIKFTKYLGDPSPQLATVIVKGYRDASPFKRATLRIDWEVGGLLQTCRTIMGDD